MTDGARDVPLIANYEIRSEIGRDSVGRFFLAQHSVLQTDVVIKWMHKECSHDPAIVRLFRSDAAGAANVNADGIIRVLDCGEIHGRPYLIKEYVQGTTLLDYLANGPLAVERALELTMALSRVFIQLQIHGMPPVGGLRPSNILIANDGRVKISRIDRMKAFAGAPESSPLYGAEIQNVQRLGDDDLHYVAPEILTNWKGKRSETTQVYLLAAHLHFMLTCEPPFGLEEDPISRIANTRSPNPLPDAVPDAIRSLVNKALAPKADQRHQTYVEFIAELQQTLDSIRQREPDVFISSKSEDYSFAGSVFDYLMLRSIPTFLSDKSLPRLSDADYRRQIDHALDASQHMVVVTSSRAYVESSWVEAEWGLFVNEKRAGRKTGNIITITVGDLTTNDLPPTLRYYQVLTHAPNNFPVLLEYVTSRDGKHHVGRPSSE